MNKKIVFSLLVALAFSLKIGAMQPKNISKSKMMENVKKEEFHNKYLAKKSKQGLYRSAVGNAYEKFSNKNINSYINSPKYNKAKVYRAKATGSVIKSLSINNNDNNDNTARRLNFE